MNQINQMEDFCKLMYSMGEDIRYYVQCGDAVLTKAAYKEITGQDYDEGATPESVAPATSVSNSATTSQAI